MKANLVLVSIITCCLFGCRHCTKASPSASSRSSEFLKTVTDFPDANVLFNAAHSFDIDFQAKFDPATVKEIRITIDTSGLSYDSYACDHGVPDSCDDDLEIVDVVKWHRCEQASQSSNTVPGMDPGEQKVFSDSRNTEHFAAAKEAIKDGKITVSIYPYAGDDYRVVSVTLAVLYK